MVRWAAAVDQTTLYTSVLVIGEIRRGIERKRRSAPAPAIALDAWLARIRLGLGPRVLSVDERVADAWSQLGVPDPPPAVDGLIAATALIHGLTVVTRNIADLERTGVNLLNPFDA